MSPTASGPAPGSYDIAIIGGGINGCGIAGDAAGRDWSVFLREKGDLTGATSSAASKLIHGGLRYLRSYEFRLVREALLERETPWRIAPHIIWPPRFVLPHHKGFRPAWLQRLARFLAAGPWVGDVLNRVVGANAPASVRLVKGSHFVTGRPFGHDRCCIFQNSDRRIFFAIPYEQDFTLIGTTDLDYTGDPGAVEASDAEIDCLCKAASDYFRSPVTPDLVKWRYSGVRPLFDDGAEAAQSATRDYVLRLDAQGGAPAPLSVFGGKITTYRRLAEAAVAMLSPHLPTAPKPASWTAKASLPGGDFPVQGFEALVGELQRRYAAFDGAFIRRLARAYRTRVPAILKDAWSQAELGRGFGAGLIEAELDDLARSEWAVTADDVVRRRSKLGPRLSKRQIDDIDTCVRATRLVASAGAATPGWSA